MESKGRGAWPQVFRAPEGLTRRAGLLCAPVGGGPPARRPRRVLLLVAPRVFRAPEGPAAREARASLRSAPRLEARPCLATADGYRSLVLRTPNVVWLVVQ